MTFTDLQFVAALGVLTMNMLVLVFGALAIMTMALVITAVCKR
jgi:hypothetical protein